MSMVYETLAQILSFFFLSIIICLLIFTLIICLTKVVSIRQYLKNLFAIIVYFAPPTLFSYVASHFATTGNKVMALTWLVLTIIWFLLVALISTLQETKQTQNI